ncbi:MAG: UDP-4-amino-4,6-dideoxy-N-acetyl-beta-L-altrosamine N-acetyltransferase [Idiomarina sp.]|nr:UDP-4-amino-4,6-dideoxy-N-acetyl-beta-L-altrosamine N-acetyltransferase [Idiomarina sp.]
MNWPPAFQRYGIRLKPLSKDDLERVRQWRNSSDIAQHMLDQTHITHEMQLKWFAGLQGDQTRAYWVAWFKDEPIGVASLTAIHHDAGTVEPGMYIYPEQYRNNIVPFCVAFALNDVAFEELQLSCLKGKIFEDNDASKRFHEKCGYRYTGRDDNLLFYELNYDDYVAARAPLARFIRY